MQPQNTNTTTYNVKSGDTLGGIASSTGQTIQSLMAANPNITNPNLIYAGSSLNIPSIQTSSSVASSGAASNLTNAALNNLSNYENRPAPNIKKTKKSDLSLEDIVGQDEQSYYSAQNQLLDDQYNNFITSLNNYKTSNDNITNNLIANIQARFEGYRAKQKNTNKALEAGTFIAGARSGRMRYATEMQDSMIAAEVSAGLQRLSELDLQESDAILKALEAKTNRDFDLLVKEMDMADKTREAKRKTLLDIYDVTLQVEQIANQRTKNLMDNLDLEKSQLTDVAYAIMSDYENAPDKEQFINEYADQYGINPVTLRGVMEQVKSEQFADMPALVQEYEYASQNGFSGSFMDYQRTVEAISRAGDNPTKLTSAEAEALGLPQQLVGKTDQEIITSFNSPTPPDWFESGFSTGDGGMPSSYAISTAWNQYRQPYASAINTFAKFRSGVTANKTFGSDNSSELNPEDLFGSDTTVNTSSTTTETRKEKRKRKREERRANKANK